MATTDQTDETVPTVQVLSTHHSQFEMLWREFRQSTPLLVRSAIILMILLTALFTPFFAPHDPTTQSEVPDSEHNPMPMGAEILIEGSVGEVVGAVTAYLGTDHHGRDILSRIIHGSRTLMTVPLSVVSSAMALGVVAGVVAGYYRNTWVDEVVMHFMDILFSFPSFVLATAVISILEVGSTEYGFFALPDIVKVIAITGVIYILSFAHTVRGSALKEMEEGYIDAAKSLNTSSRHILLKDIAVNILPTIVAQGTLYMGMAALASVTLSLPGLGIQPPSTSLGLMLSDARGYPCSGEWWHSVLPELTIVVAILGFNLLGDGLRDALDPRNDGGGR